MGLPFTIAERNIQLPQKGVAGNVPNQLIPKRANNAAIERGSWGQLQWLCATCSPETV